jgi:YHS domain-containing protein
MAKDPVCGMDVHETVARHTAQHNGQTLLLLRRGL